MKRTLLSLAMLAAAMAGAQTITLPDATAMPGETITLPVCVESDFEPMGFQFEITLPDGIVCNEWSLTLPDGVDGSSAMTMTDGRRFAAALSGANFASSGEIATITLAISEDVSGTFVISVTDAGLCDSAYMDYVLDDTSFTLTVGTTTAVEGLKGASMEQRYDLYGLRGGSRGGFSIVGGKVVYGWN